MINVAFALLAIGDCISMNRENVISALQNEINLWRK